MAGNTINRLFEESAAGWPYNTAIVDASGQINYKELNRKANRAAHYLISKGIGREMFVGVVMDHSIDMVAALLAVIKSGAAYVLMEPDFPIERINFILRETGAKAVFTQEKYSRLFGNGIELIFDGKDFSSFPDTNPVGVVDENNALYVLYTSGTTGSPKGVIVEHRNVANYAEAFAKEFGLTEKDSMLQCSVCTFDIFVEEFFPVLLAGGTLVIAYKEQAQNPSLLLGLAQKERVTIMSVFPYALQDMDKMEIPACLRLAISGGDVLCKEYVPNLVKKVAVYNTYGPSETTVCATYYNYIPETTPTESVPVGKPVSGVRVYILDEELKPVPQGETGEICIAGAGVSRGYLNRPSETAAAFVPDPFFPGERMYRSGDLGVMLEDGNIDFIHRKDEQVMIGGRRVEPLEVENVMSRCGGVDMAIVKSFTDKSSRHYLVGYYVGEGAEPAAIKDYLRKYVPEYMVPEHIVRLNDIPKTFNGKIDRNNLPFVEKKHVNT